MSAHASDAVGEGSPAAYQRGVLPYVSRTFALTIPQLPEPVADIVTNAYLLCRIADTIEDDPALDAAAKAQAQARFLATLDGDGDADAFGRRTAAQLSAATPDAERALVHETGRVVAFARSLEPREREVVRRCVAIMCRGMSEYQRRASPAGLPDMHAVDRYCYYVAGVVGEMLTEVFALHSPGVRAHRDEMLALATSFGEGLQLTNILKDTREDQQRGACWLPRDVFAHYGVDLERVRLEALGRRIEPPMRHMVAVAHGHLRDALQYTLLIPREQTGMRRFCLWAIGMAVLTLWRIHRRPAYARGEQVKISRRMVKAVIVGSNLSARHDRLLRALFATITAGLPRRERALDPGLSDWTAQAAAGGEGPDSRMRQPGAR